MRWTDERTERVIAALLRGGVAVATLLVAAGTAIALARHGGRPAAFGRFVGEPAALRGIAGVVREALRGSGRGIAQLGLLTLVATPIARVAFSVVAFAAQRDATFVVVTLAVLAALGVGLHG